MDLDDGVESTPGLIGDQTRIVPFLGAHNLNDKQQQNCCKPSGQNLQQRHNSALAVSIETDVWLLGETFSDFFLSFQKFQKDFFQDFWKRFVEQSAKA